MSVKISEKVADRGDFVVDTAWFDRQSFTVGLVADNGLPGGELIEAEPVGGRDRVLSLQPLEELFQVVAIFGQCLLAEVQSPTVGNEVIAKLIERFQGSRFKVQGCSLVTAH